MMAVQNKIDDIKFDDHTDLRLSAEETGTGGAVLLRMAGLVDTYNSDFFRNQVLKIIEAGYRFIIFDVSGVSFMSSTGIGAFTALLKTVRQAEGQIVLSGVPGKIYEVFQLLGFTSFFRFSATNEEALSLLTVEDEPDPVFPLAFSCPVCSRRLRASRSGRFRCSSCKVVLAVDGSGDVCLG